MDLLNRSQVFPFFVFKFTVFFFLLFRDKQQSIISILSKLLLNRWWQILYCRRPFLLDGIKLVFNDIYRITSLLHMLQYSSLFQKKALHPVLCPVGLRWVEDKQCAVRLLELWPNMVKVINHWECWPKWKRLSSKSYANFLTAVNDNLIPAELQFFSFTASLFEPFLLKYQSNKLMLHF